MGPEDKEESRVLIRQGLVGHDKGFGIFLQ